MVYGRKEEKGHTVEVIERSVVGVARLTVVGNLGGNHFVFWAVGFLKLLRLGWRWMSIGQLDVHRPPADAVVRSWNLWDVSKEKMGRAEGTGSGALRAIFICGLGKGSGVRGGVI